MSRSLGEVASIAYLATRGAGYPWGLAEEAAHAVRWLTAAGGDGCALLVRCLEAGLSGDGWEAHCPDPADGWQATGPLCPLMTGAALSDHRGAVAQLPETVAPGLLLPFLAGALSGDAGVSVRTEAGAAEVSADGCLVTGDLSLRSGVRVAIGVAPPLPSRIGRAHVAPAVWEALGCFAARTYAPATEASRLKGAGAGLSDND